jgi:hypothetical protein
MDEKKRLFIMRIVALIVTFSFMYPVTILLRNILFGNDGGYLFILLLSVYTAVGFTAGSMVAGERKTIFDNIYFLLALILIPVVVTAFACIGSGLWRVVFEEVCLGFFYVTALRTGVKSMDTILEMRRVYTGAVFILSSLMISRYLESCMYLMNRTIVFSCVFVVLSMLYKNQEALDINLLSRKCEDKASLPHRIRSFNVISVLSMTAIVFLLFYFKGIMVFLLETAGKILGFLIMVFFKIMALLMPGGTEGGAQHGEMQKPELPVDESKGSPILDIIFKLLFLIIAIYLLYRIAPVMFRKLKALMEKVFDIIKRLFALGKSDAKKDIEEYIDEIEILKPTEKLKNGNIKKRKTSRSLRGLKKISDPVKRIRYMYALLLDMLNAKRQLIKPEFTVREICREVSPLMNSEEAMKDFTRIYENVRYGDRVPGSSEIYTAEQNFKNIISQS